MIAEVRPSRPTAPPGARVCPEDCRGICCHVRVHECDEGDIMGKEARTGLLLGATCCLLAVMVDWIVTELK
jgi:hypothetical protein